MAGFPSLGPPPAKPAGISGPMGGPAMPQGGQANQAQIAQMQARMKAGQMRPMGGPTGALPGGQFGVAPPRPAGMPAATAPRAAPLQSAQFAQRAGAGMPRAPSPGGAFGMQAPQLQARQTAMMTKRPQLRGQIQQPFGGGTTFGALSNRR